MSKKIASNNGKKQTIGFESDDDISYEKEEKKYKSSGIPNKVANRMARRIAFSTGIPTLSGMGVFVGSYILISKGIADISPTLTLTVSAICFFVGLIGLSYGILSASWDDSSGSLMGIENIKPNIQRMRSAFKSKE